MNKISIWVILWKLIYTTVHSTQKCGRLYLLSNQPSIKFSEGLPKIVQAERVNILALHWEYISNMACLGVYRYISKKDLFIYLDSFGMFVLCISMSSTKSASSSKSVLSVC